GEHRGLGIVSLDGGNAIGLVADLKQSHVSVGSESFALQKISGGKIGVTTEATNGKAFDFLKVLYSFPGVDTIIHGIAESAEHDQVQRRCRNHDLRREHADLCIAR